MSSVPVLYYHRVNDFDPVPQDVSQARFAEQMAFLANDGWNTVTPSELNSFVNRNTKLPRKSVLITFDDGYLDNWVYAYPILKRHRLKATIFLITDRITDAVNSPRPNMEDVEAGRIARESLPPVFTFSDANRKGLRSDAEKAEGHLVWAEVRAMRESGLISFGSHAHTHATHYIGAGMTGIINSDIPHWTQGFPTGGDTRLGIPIYEQASALTGKRYYDDPALRDVVAKFVDDSGGAPFFFQKGAKVMEKIIGDMVRDYRKKHGDRGRFEDDSERRARVMNEMVTSRRILEERLGAPPESICWPFGQFDDVSIQSAKEAGYSMAFTTRNGANRRGTDPFHLRRLTIRDWPAQKTAMLLRFWTSPLAPVANIFPK